MTPVDSPVDKISASADLNFKASKYTLINLQITENSMFCPASISLCLSLSTFRDSHT